MRPPTRRIIAKAALVVIAARGVQSFVAPRCTIGSSLRGASSADNMYRGCRNFERGEQHTCLTSTPAVEDYSGGRTRPAPFASMRAATNSADTRSPFDASVTVSNTMTEEQRTEREELNENRDTGRKNRQLRWAGVRRSLARGAASLATITFGATAISGVSAEVKHRTEGAVSMPLAMPSAQASIFKPFARRTVEEKLGNIPAFMITNGKGSPYLTPTPKEGHQLAVFFTNLDDAKQVLREMAQSPSYAGDARILVVSMEKAYTMVKTGAKQTGYQNEGGKEESMDFKLERDHHSIPKAEKLGLKFQPSAKQMSIPVFHADGLEIKRDGTMVSPLFMDPADLVTAWQKAAADNPDMPSTPSVKVLDLPEVIIAMEISDDLNNFGFFASTESAEYITAARAAGKGAPKPRLGRMWSF